MKDQFFYKSKGRTHGPVRFGVLVSLLRQGKIAPDDSVRTQGSNAWQRVDFLMNSLVSEFPEIADASVTEDSESDPVAASAQARKTSTAARRTVSTRSSVLSFFEVISEGFVAFVINIFSAAFGWVQKKHLIILLVLAGWGVLNTYFYYQTKPPYEQEVASYEALGGIWDDLKKLRNGNASEDDWMTFEARVKPQLEAMSSELQIGATTSNQIRMRLLWASRDYLPKMLGDARKTPSSNEALFVAHMRDTARLLTEAGQPVAEF